LSIGIAEFVLMIEELPKLDIDAVYVRDLAFGGGLPAGIDGLIPIERHWKQRSSQAPIYVSGGWTAPFGL